MNIKTAVKYQIHGFKKPLLIYYFIIYVVFILAAVSANSANRRGAFVSLGGIEVSSMIFIFISGLNSFRETFKMFLQNGLSRKTLFISFAYSIISISAIMAFIDSINGVLARIFSIYQSAFIQFYWMRYSESSNRVLKFIEGFLWYIFTYAMLAMIGYFITVLYYRMNKALKLLVSIGVPFLFLIIIPMIDSNVTGGVISKGITNFFSFAWGYKNGFNPYFSMVTCTIIFALFGGLSYLLIRKAVVKE